MDDFDDSASADTTDTYGSGIDGDSYPPAGGAGRGEEDSEAVEDFKIGVYKLTEKRCSPDLISLFSFFVSEPLLHDPYCMYVAKDNTSTCTCWAHLELLLIILL